MQLTTLVAYLNDLLDVNQFEDYCPNGLQVEGTHEVNRVITGVTASQELLDRCVEEKADAVVVHHGYFWRGEAPQIVGIVKQRLQTLLTHNISLLAYHLPLDVQPILGNNKGLAEALALRMTGHFNTSVPGLGCVGETQAPIEAVAFAERIASALQRSPLMIGNPAKKIRRVAWCTGGAQDYLVAAAQADVDAYITGEVSERTVHEARELGVVFYAAGHHATERFGVQALAQRLDDEFDIQASFVDVDNPV